LNLQVKSKHLVVELDSAVEVLGGVQHEEDFVDVLE
jgi:hypothetical protein